MIGYSMRENMELVNLYSLIILCYANGVYSREWAGSGPRSGFFLDPESRSRHFSELLDFSFTQGKESGQGTQLKSRTRFFEILVF